MAIEVYDIALTENNLPKVSGGDFVIDESTKQHQKLLLIANKGQFREFPSVGVGINNFFLDDGDTGALKQEIIKQFELDGMQINEIEANGALNLKIDATYI